MFCVNPVHDGKELLGLFSIVGLVILVAGGSRVPESLALSVGQLNDLGVSGLRDDSAFRLRVRLDDLTLNRQGLLHALLNQGLLLGRELVPPRSDPYELHDHSVPVS